MTGSASSARATLEQRARLLARPLENEAALREAGMVSLLTVHFGDERGAIALEHLLEIHRPTILTPIPGAGPPVVGVIAWRGRVLTVLDLAPTRRAPLAISDTTRILIVGQKRASFGIVVDDIEDVRLVNMQDVLPVENVARERRDFIRGALEDAAVVLDAHALIARFAPTH